MRRLFAALLLLPLPVGTGCQEPPKTAQMDDMVSSLCNLNTWDRYMMAKGNGTFDQVMGAGPDIYPVLIDHLADETETAIEDEMTGRKPKVCDLVLLMLLELMHRKW